MSDCGQVRVRIEVIGDISEESSKYKAVNASERQPESRP